MNNARSLRFGPISPAADGPLYEQVIAAVKREVASGALKPGDQLPSVRTLAADLLVSVITIRRAYDDLEREGIIYSRQGLGAFVAEMGEAQVRKRQTDAARQALCAAVHAGREAGLTDEQLLEMLQSEITRGNKP